MKDCAEIGRKLAALNLWDQVAPFHWAIKPKGTVFPYFCSVVKDTGGQVKTRFLLLEGWQTFHDYVRTAIDNGFGFYSSPMEMPHFEMIVLADGSVRFFRHDTGYMPVEIAGSGTGLLARLLWQAYGVMMRIETDRDLALSFAAEKSVFARVEGDRGRWSDQPLEIPPARPHTERVSFAKDVLKKAGDLPFAKDEVLEVALGIVMNAMTREERPRMVYGLVGIDAATGKTEFFDRASVQPDSGLRGLWEHMPPQLLTHIVERGRVPGEIRVDSARTFRMLRPLCVDLPFKLSLHNRLERTAAVLAGGRV